MILQLGESQSSQLEPFFGPTTRRVEADLFVSLWVLLHSLGDFGLLAWESFFDWIQLAAAS